MRKKYPLLPPEVIREHEVMSDEEIKALSESANMGESGEKGKEVEGTEANAGPTPPAPCHNDRLKNTQKNAQANSVPMEPLAPTPLQMEREIETNLRHSLAFLTKRIMEKVQKGEPLTSDDRADLRLIDDLYKSTKWTKEFREYIKQNPGMLIRPGSMGGASTQQTRNLESQLRKSARKDGRKSSTPPRPASGDGITLPA